MDRERNKELAGLFCAAQRPGQEHLVDEVLAPNWRLTGVVGGGVEGGPEAFKRLMAQVGAAFSERDNVVEDLIAEGNKVVARVSARIKHTGEFLGIPATGSDVVYSVVFIHTIEDGKIAESFRVGDELGRLRQLGAEIRPPTKGA
jgi:predicted ester cyclase